MPAGHSTAYAAPSAEQRSQAAPWSGQQHRRSSSAMQSKGESSAAAGSRTPSARREYSPEKENRPLAFPMGPASPSKAPREATNRSWSAESAQRASSGQSQIQATGSVKPTTQSKTRSMSPSKRFKGKLKGGDDEEYVMPRSSREIDTDFMQMLNDMQVPATMIHKLITLDARVKEAMMRGRDSLTLAALSAAAGQDSLPYASASSGKAKAGLSGILRRPKSSATLAEDMDELRQPKSRSSIFGGSSRTPSAESSSAREDTPPSPNKLYSASNASATSLFRPRSRAASFSSVRSSGSTNRAADSFAAATAFATMLKANDSSRLDVARVKRMRAILSSESPAWLTEFFDEGGYTAMLARLKELLDMEWREEQHDDNLLHELLRCFVALASTDCGREALASSVPSPFAELASLLYSEKRPGDLSTRKLLVDLLCILAELPGPSKPLTATQSARAEHESSTLTAHIDRAQSCPPHFSLLVALLHNVRDPSKEAIVDFISASHTPRPFKALVTELLNVNRDYFWVFCHGSNRFWALRSVDISEVEGPKVPGGMTGGVEFEAMAYQTSLMRLVNLLASRVGRIAQTEGPKHLARDLHHLLFSSGLQRALAITRKASQVYYQPLHLELSRYFDYARRAEYRLPAELEMYQNTPQFLSIAAQHALPTRGGADLQLRPPAQSSPTSKPTATSYLPLSTSSSSIALPFSPNNQDVNQGAQDKKRSRELSQATEQSVFRSQRQGPASTGHTEANRLRSEQSPKKESRDLTSASVVGNAVRQWEKLNGQPSSTAAMPLSPSKRFQAEQHKARLSGRAPAS